MNYKRAQSGELELFITTAERTVYHIIMFDVSGPEEVVYFCTTTKIMVSNNKNNELNRDDLVSEISLYRYQGTIGIQITKILTLQKA
jgi:hypothetical protein